MDRCTCGRMPGVMLLSRRYKVVCPNCQREGKGKISPYLAELAWKEELEQQNLPQANLSLERTNPTKTRCKEGTGQTTGYEKFIHGPGGETSRPATKQVILWKEIK